MEIPDNWLPTPTNINSLPDPIRKYIHQLQTRTDPAGDVRRIAELKDQVEALQVMLAREPSEERVERAARLIWFVFGDDMSVRDALAPANDAHWRHWRTGPPARTAYVAARAILEARKKREG